jgi:exo beta-1,2-glucooligosaccharide sophorohydrolase (non-reducing end)
LSNIGWISGWTEGAWDPVPSVHVEGYVIYRSCDGKNFQPIGIQVRGITRYTDYLGKPPRTAHSIVAASDATYRQGKLSGAVTATTRALTDDELLAILQEECFRSYREGALADSGTGTRKPLRKEPPTDFHERWRAFGGV